MTEPQSGFEVLTHPSKLIRIADIDSELAGLWTQFNEDISEGKTVMRACMSNLIIYCDSDDELQSISREISDIVDAHPARVLLLMGNGLPSDGKIEALITMYYQAVPAGWQVCAERIDVISTPESTDYLPSVARAHLIATRPAQMRH